MELIRLPPRQAGLYAALGPRHLPSLFLRALCPALGHGRRVLWIDAGNGFDAHGLGLTAKALGLDPRRVLAQVSLARPFNVYQLEAMVKAKLPAAWRGEPVVLSDPLAPFFDPDLPEEDVPKALRGVREGLAAVPAVWLVLAVLRRAPRGREAVLEGLIAGSKLLEWRG